MWMKNVNADWFADFYGKDLESGAPLFSVQKERKYFGASGVTDYLFNENNVEVQGHHQTKMLFPLEEQNYQKLNYDRNWKPIEDQKGDSIPELLNTGHLQGKQFADEVQEPV